MRSSRRLSHTIDAMNIEILSAGLYEDSNGVVTSVLLEESGDLAFVLECDDWNGSERRRQFTIRCKRLFKSDLCVGSANAISLYREHPLLLDRTVKQGVLYFSSRPVDAYQIYAEIWDLLAEQYGGWLIPSEMIGHSPSSFRALLDGGYGLLLRGPLFVLASAQARIDGAVKTQLVETHTVQGGGVALIVEDRFVICDEVEVAEHAAQGPGGDRKQAN
jgi:hypothetical protein